MHGDSVETLLGPSLAPEVRNHRRVEPPLECLLVVDAADIALLRQTHEIELALGAAGPADIRDEKLSAELLLHVAKALGVVLIFLLKRRAFLEEAVRSQKLGDGAVDDVVGIDHDRLGHAGIAQARVVARLIAGRLHRVGEQAHYHIGLAFGGRCIAHLGYQPRQ